MFNGILWILRTGAPWADLPDRYPSYQTCHRRFEQWSGWACCGARSSRRHSSTMDIWICWKRLSTGAAFFISSEPDDGSSDRWRGCGGWHELA